MNWGEAFFERYVKLFGNPINQAVWEKEGFGVIQILTFAPSSDLLVFASIGLTLYPNELGGIFEVFVTAAEKLRDVPNVFGQVLTGMVEKSQKLGVGLSFPFEKMFPDFAAATGKTALYFTGVAGLENLDVVELGDEQGKLLVGFFISAAENDFLGQNGPEKFEAALRKAGAVPSDLNRKSIF